MSSNEFYGYLTPEEKNDLSLEKALDIEMSKANLLYEMQCLKNDIHMKEAELKVLTESGDYNDLCRYYESDNDNEKTQKQNPLVRAVKAIAEFLKKVLKAFTDAMNKIFKGGKVEAKYDVEASKNPVQDVKDAKKLFGEGKKLVDKCNDGKATEKEVSTFKDKVAGFIERHSSDMACSAIQGVALGAGSGIGLAVGAKILKVKAKDIGRFREEMNGALDDFASFSDRFFNTLPVVKQANDLMEKLSMGVINAMGNLTKSVNKSKAESVDIILNATGDKVKTVKTPKEKPNPSDITLNSKGSKTENK